MPTRRQVETLQTLLQLFGDSPAGVHYTTLARRMGVSKWAAYDMLRTLEEKGLVERHCHTAKKRARGGRPRLMFEPTREEFTVGTASQGRRAARIEGRVQEPPREAIEQRVLAMYMEMDERAHLRSS